MPNKSRIENWIDNHRELLLLLIILPIGKVLSIRDGIVARLRQPQPGNHTKRVERIQYDVRKAAEVRSGDRSEDSGFLRTDRSGTRSLTTRMADKKQSMLIQMNDMRSILSVDKDRGIVRVEPFVTIGELVSHLYKSGMQLECAIEMKGATVGGLVLAIGMTTHSHVTGLMHDIVQAYEIVTSNGNLIRAESENEHADLFRALPWSHGTLGLLVALELRIIPASPYVRLVYRPYFNHEAFCNEHVRLLNAENPPDYLEGQIFGRNRAVIIEGFEAGFDKTEHLKVNRVNRWNKPFFFKHVETMLSLEPGSEFQELVPKTEYLMRHERSMCMTMGKILPTANRPWYRYLFGWMMPPNMQLLKSSRPPEERERSMRQQVYQDFAFPARYLKQILNHLDETFEIYPLLLYPCRVFDRGGMVRLPGQRGEEWDGKTRSDLYLNLGIYGEPKAIRNGVTEYPTIEKVREIEGMIRDFGGFLHTYVDVFSTREEFETMFDHTLWRRMRRQYSAEGIFPEIYDKIKPEVDPLQFLGKNGENGSLSKRST